MDAAKALCCTWKGVDKLKRLTAITCGSLIITTSVLAILSFSDILGTVRSIWNIIFGVLMLLIQFNWKAMISRNFGFLQHWFLRGCFYIFVGTNAMVNEGAEFKIIFSYCAGFACVFVGVVELLFGFKCAPENAAEGDTENPVKGRHHVEPTLNVNGINLTANQVQTGAQFAANNAGTIAAVGNAAAAANSGGGASANPFFGNSHLK